MLPEKFELAKCWDDARLGQVINKEATSIDVATFMATHAPLNDFEYGRLPQQSTNNSEIGLLNELRHCANKNIHAFFTILGIPGTGKSHLIRWLKERYAIESEQQECVLFIARSQCSLRNTLEQIITSGIFDEVNMHDQLEQLRNARTSLSREALADTLLDHLRVGVLEVQDIETPRWLKKGDRIRTFLLDRTVRGELMKHGGPIDRIARFLSEGSKSGIEGAESPQFEERDFAFKTDIGRMIDSYAYPETKEVVDRIIGDASQEKREEIANYLNQLLPYAIGYATALTSEDFKNIFFDLRRQLYAQNKQLALFIEDITALTGIDLGLLDVLVTQHTEVGNQNLCRVLSVIGITDTYFDDHFPDHMKDRVTHIVTLNAKDKNVSDTVWLGNSEMTAKLAAHYLNAMRLDHSELAAWYRQGGRLDQLPNACDGCPLRAPCHASFGYQNIGVEAGQEIHIGLYPFNETALWNLYRRSSNKRTPRSFLNSVLYYILQSHGSKIQLKQFPPIPTNLGGEFSTFSLTKPLQKQLISAQGGLDAGRIETLVMIWGNGTIDATTNGTQTLIGNLSAQVFSAFGIAPIKGESLAGPSTTSILNTQTNLLPTESPPHRTPTPINSPTTSLPDPKIDIHIERITNWLNGGKLQNYEDYSELLVALIRSAIQWEFYGINTIQLEDAMKGRRRICIEGQVGKMNTNYYITFKRSQSLGAVLLALTDFKERPQTLSSATIASHLSNISIWLHQHEDQIVDFVRNPNHTSTESLSLTTILILNCALLACLKGDIHVKSTSTSELLKDTLKFCVNTTEASWKEYTQTISKKRSPAWASLVKRFHPTLIVGLCANLLSMLNCAQGSSSEVRFIDTATALQILRDFQQNNWRLPDPECTDEPLQKLWIDALTVYQALQEYFPQALLDEKQAIVTLLDQLQAYLGENSPTDTFQAIKSMLESLATSKRGTSFALEVPVSASQYTTLLRDLNGIISKSSTSQLAPSLSQAMPKITKAVDCLTYFDAFVQEAKKQNQAITNSLAQLQEKLPPEFNQEYDKIRNLYKTVSQELKAISSINEDRNDC